MIFYGGFFIMNNLTRTHSLRSFVLPTLVAAFVSLFLIACPMADTKTEVPGKVTGLNAEGGDGEVELSWTAVAGATSYKIYRGTETGELTALDLDPAPTGKHLYR